MRCICIYLLNMPGFFPPLNFLSKLFRMCRCEFNSVRYGFVWCRCVDLCAREIGFVRPQCEPRGFHTEMR